MGEYLRLAAFPDVGEVLGELRARGIRAGILSKATRTCSPRPSTTPGSGTSSIRC